MVLITADNYVDAGVNTITVKKKIILGKND